MIVTDREIFNPSVPDLPSKDQVVELYRQKGRKHNRLTYTAPSGKTFFIKYNNTRMAEAHAQLFFYSRINANPQSTIRIPELYHAWLPGDGSRAYLVMEYIDIHHFASDEERAKALAELIAVEPPPGVFGNFGPPGRYIRHMFFKEREAAKMYSSVQELQDSINRVLQLLNYNATVDFSDEPLLCYYSDIYRENFPVDQSGNLWVVDFDATGVLPASFASWPLDTKYKHPLPIPIRRTIPLGTSKNLRPMFRAYRFNQVSVGRSGYPIRMWPNYKAVTATVAGTNKKGREFRVKTITYDDASLSAVKVLHPQLDQGNITLRQFVRPPIAQQIINFFFIFDGRGYMGCRDWM